MAEFRLNAMNPFFQVQQLRQYSGQSDGLREAVLLRKRRSPLPGKEKSCTVWDLFFISKLARVYMYAFRMDYQSWGKL
jgi:hypothetical protein